MSRELFFQQEVPVDSSFRMSARAAKHALESLLLHVFWLTSLHIPHTKLDASGGVNKDVVFHKRRLRLLAAGEPNILHYSIDESSRVGCATGVLYSAPEV
jgi:hypothetical protein